MYRGNLLTSLFKVMLDLVILAHYISVRNVNSILLMELSVTQLVVELVGRGVKRVSALVLLVAVVIIKNGGLADRHADDGAPMLVSVSRAPVAVTTLRSEQNRGNVVDLMGGFRARTLLGDPAALAPSVAGIQDEGEEEN